MPALPTRTLGRTGLEVTTLGRLAVGAKTNLEIDLVARYLERMLPAG